MYKIINAISYVTGMIFFHSVFIWPVGVHGYMIFVHCWFFFREFIGFILHRILLSMAYFVKKVYLLFCYFGCRGISQTLFTFGKYILLIEADILLL